MAPGDQPAAWQILLEASPFFPARVARALQRPAGLMSLVY